MGNAITPLTMSPNQIKADAGSNTTSARCIALVGDYSPAVLAHQAIPQALELACVATGCKVSWRWIPTKDIHDAAQELAGYDAVWLVPASPYVNMAGALAAIQWARETSRPFLGTCGGFQHALIEFARNVAGLTRADHAESNANADTLLVTPLSCSLVEKAGIIRLASGSQLQSAYGSDEAIEGYHCNYGFNVKYRARLEQAGLCFTGFDDASDVRAFELPSHPFFIGTLFQPERSALREEVHPLICAFVRAVKSFVPNKSSSW